MGVMNQNWIQSILILIYKKILPKSTTNLEYVDIIEVTPNIKQS